MPQFALLSIPVFLPLNMLSGGPSPLEAMPEPLQVAIQISPAMHFVKFTQSVLCRGAGIDLVWPHLIAIVVLGAIFLAIAIAVSAACWHGCNSSVRAMAWVYLLGFALVLWGFWGATMDIGRTAWSSMRLCGFPSP